MLTVERRLMFLSSVRKNAIISLLNVAVNETEINFIQIGSSAFQPMVKQLICEI